MSRQPAWTKVGSFGDADPIEHSGGYIYTDETGAYEPEVEYIEPTPDYIDDWESGRWTIYRVCLEKCTFVNGILSENSFHPDHPAWFAGDIESVASCIGSDADDLRERLCSDNPDILASAYVDLAAYFGWGEFDPCPLILTRAEIEARHKQD